MALRMKKNLTMNIDLRKNNEFPEEKICLDPEILINLIEAAIQQYCEQQGITEKWIGPEEAMSILKIRSKTTLQRLREEKVIRSSQPGPKTVLYDRSSIIRYIEKHSNAEF